MGIHVNVNTNPIARSVPTTGSSKDILDQYIAIDLLVVHLCFCPLVHRLNVEASLLSDLMLLLGNNRSVVLVGKIKECLFVHLGFTKIH